MVGGLDAGELACMNATQTHFVTVCPHCSTGLKVRRVYLGQQVVCKHCRLEFLGEAGDRTSTMTFGNGEAGARFPTFSQGDRIDVKCPSCETTLRVRRHYIGHNVICRECERTFLVPHSTGFLPNSAVVDSRRTPLPDIDQLNGGPDRASVEWEYPRNADLEAARAR